jgi:phosphoribosylanthranilate isomerase
LFRIKICGVTSPKDAQFVVLAGADAVGLNFYSASERAITLDVADAIVKSLPPRIARVGVFVNSSAGEISEIADRLKLDWIQLHGDEPVELIAELAGRSVIRAIRFDDSALARIRADLGRCQETQAPMPALLIDAARPGEYGGTGQTVDWKALASVREHFPNVPLVLAGGLTPFNVAEAIAAVRPDAVDVASGVESKPGSKDLLLVRAFVTSAKKAFSELDSGK